MWALHSHLSFPYHQFKLVTHGIELKEYNVLFKLFNLQGSSLDQIWSRLSWDHWKKNNTYSAHRCWNNYTRSWFDDREWNDLPWQPDDLVPAKQKYKKIKWGKQQRNLGFAIIHNVLHYKVTEPKLDGTYNAIAGRNGLKAKAIRGNLDIWIIHPGFLCMEEHASFHFCHGQSVFFSI